MSDPWLSSPNAYFVFCPHCERPVAAESCGAIEGSERCPSLIELLRCKQCRQAIVTVRVDYGEGWDEFTRLWPPQARPLSSAIPEQLRREHEEARKCYEAKAFTAAVVLVRRTLEGVCAEAGVTERNLVRSLAALQEKGLIDGHLNEWAQALRVLGNEGAHYTGRPVSRDDASDALEFSEAMLDYMYVLTAKFEEFKQRRSGARENIDEGSST